MLLLMVPTPIVMVGCGFDAATGAGVVGWHVVAMFAPSFVTGFLIKRFGATAIVHAGLSLLAVASLVAATGLTLPQMFPSSLRQFGPEPLDPAIHRRSVDHDASLFQGDPQHPDEKADNASTSVPRKGRYHVENDGA